ncbi:reverse transcriptase domain-containing protein [Tanacetum coccineum]
MAPETATAKPQLFLENLELGVTVTIVLMFCRMWDVYAATGRYLSTDFVVYAAGYVTNVGRIVQQKTGSKTLDFHLANSRGQSVRVTLWGSLGELLIEKEPAMLGCRLYLSSTSSTLILDDEEIPEVKQLKADSSSWCGNSAKEMPPVGCLEIMSGPRMAGIFHLAKGKNARKALPVLTAAFFVNPATKLGLSSIKGDDRSPLPQALANIVGTNHTLEFKSHTYYEHNTYESFTCWRIVTAEGMGENGGSSMAGGSRASETPEFKTQKAEESDAEASFVADTQTASRVGGSRPDTRKNKRLCILVISILGFIIEDSVGDHMLDGCDLVLSLLSLPHRSGYDSITWEQPIPHGRTVPYHLNGSVHMMTARKRVGPLPIHHLAMRHSADHSSSDSSSEASSDFHSDASYDSFSETPIRRSVPLRHRTCALSTCIRSLYSIRADLIPSPKRVKDFGYLADVEVDHREISLRDDAIVRVSDEPHLEQDSDLEIQGVIARVAFEEFRREQGHRYCLGFLSRAVIALTEMIAEFERINMEA